MSVIVNNHQMTIEDREFLLVDITNSPGLIGVASYSLLPNHPHEKPPHVELLYAEDQAIVNLTRPPKGDEYTDKLIHQISTVSVADDTIKTILSTVSDNYFTYSQNMTRALQPFFDILSDGLYVCHESKMIPSDGAGNFFWTGYTMRHEVTGSASRSRTIAPQSNFVPCFLIPTLNPSEYSEQKAKAQREKLTAGKKVGGLAYHISGMFSALLDGHHSATACLSNNEDFNCIVVEPLCDVLYETPEQAAEFGREPIIVALSCPHIKIPVGDMPPQMLESFLLRRSGVRPKHFPSLVKSANKSLRTVSRKSIPREIQHKAEHLPDCAAIISANSVTELSDEQLDALLAGEIKYDDKIIISPNYYNSVVTACNYLQYENFDRYLRFAKAIVTNPDLAATHKYIIDRLNGITDKRISMFFEELIKQAAPMHEDYMPLLDNYVRAFIKHESDNLADKNQRAQKLNHALGMLGGDVSESSMAQMEAIARQSRRG
jgi:hypothetical protein